MRVFKKKTSGPTEAHDNPWILAAHNRKAAEQLLRELLPRVRNLVRYLIRNDMDVDDISQEALLAVHKGLKTYRGEGRFESWVDRIVARVTFAEIPKRRRAAERPNRQPPNLALLPSSTPVLNDYLSRRRMAMSLDQLPDAQRQVLILHHVLEMSVPEISQELAIPLETVRSRLRLGRERLRQVLMQNQSQGGRSDDDLPST